MASNGNGETIEPTAIYRPGEQGWDPRDNSRQISAAPTSPASSSPAVAGVNPSEALMAQMFMPHDQSTSTPKQPDAWWNDEELPVAASAGATLAHAPVPASVEAAPTEELPVIPLPISGEQGEWQPEEVEEGHGKRSWLVVAGVAGAAAVLVWGVPKVLDSGSEKPIPIGTGRPHVSATEAPSDTDSDSSSVLETATPRKTTATAKATKKPSKSPSATSTTSSTPSSTSSTASGIPVGPTQPAPTVTSAPSPTTTETQTTPSSTTTEQGPTLSQDMLGALQNSVSTADRDSAIAQYPSLAQYLTVQGAADSLSGQTAESLAAFEPGSDNVVAADALAGQDSQGVATMLLANHDDVLKQAQNKPLRSNKILSGADLTDAMIAQDIPLLILPTDQLSAQHDRVLDVEQVQLADGTPVVEAAVSAQYGAIKTVGWYALTYANQEWVVAAVNRQQVADLTPQTETPSNTPTFISNPPGTESTATTKPAPARSRRGNHSGNTHHKHHGWWPWS